MRVSSILVAPALLALLFSVSPTGTLPRPALEPLFDPDAAVALATQLSTEYPSRVPGTPESADAAHWFAETVESFGFAAEEDRWTEDIAELGEVELRNVVAVIPGRASEAIVLVAHRDNEGADRPHADNASGTAALIELARGFAPRGASVAPQPQRTLVLVSTDAGAYGGAGAARFVAESPYADDAFAAIVLDALDGSGEPRIAIAGDEPRSPAPAFVRTAVARVQEQLGVEPGFPDVLSQLVGLAVPYAAGEQGRFLASGIAALTITAEEQRERDVPAVDSEPLLSEQRLGELGQATEALLGSIDTSVGAAFRTPDSLFVNDRVASGWAVRLTLLVAVVPFALGALDLLVRSRRRGLPLAPAARALRARALIWLYAGLLLWFAGFTGILPTGASLPPSPHSALGDDWPLAGLALLGVAFAVGWLAGRRRLVADRALPEERLAGYVVAFTWLTGVSVLIGLVQPYALVFVLPSLYAWLWLPLRSSLWARAGLFLLGLAGPAAGLAVLARDLDLGLPATALYVAGLATVGYVSPLTVLFALGWATAAAQLAALAFGRYSPYAAGAEPPPPGVLLTAIRALAARSRGGYARAR